MSTKSDTSGDMSTKGHADQKSDPTKKPVKKKHFMDFVKGRTDGELGPEQSKAMAAGFGPSAGHKSSGKVGPKHDKPRKDHFMAFMKGELEE